MANENAQLAEFADNLWQNFLKQKFLNESKDVLSFYRATVVSNDGNNRLTIQKPFDDSYQVACTDSMADATAGMQVIVIRFGYGVNNKNHIVFAKGDGNSVNGSGRMNSITLGSDPTIYSWEDLLQLMGTQDTGRITVQSETTTWESVTHASGMTNFTGGYFTEGKHVYVHVRFRGIEMTAGTAYDVLSGFPNPVVTNPCFATVAGSGKTGTAHMLADGTLRYRPTADLASTSFVVISGQYLTTASYDPYISVDTALSSTSTNPVENRVIYSALQSKADVADVPVGLPTGGTAGQFLTKQSDSDYDIGWG